MLVETIVSCAIGGAVYRYLENKRKMNEKAEVSPEEIEKNENMWKWIECLDNADIKGIKDKRGDTFRLFKYKKTDFGFTAKTKAPIGVNWQKLKDIESNLETAFNGMVEISKGRYDEEINITMVTKKPEFVFAPIKTKSCDELLIMHKADGKPVFIGLDENPHLIFTGKSGTGKTFVEFMSITNMIYNYKNDFDMYICQIVNGETKIFSKTKPVKMVADTLEEAVVVLNKLVKIAEEREKKISKYGYISVKHWNKDHPRKKFKRIILLMDEFSFFRVEDGDSEEEKKMKLECEKAFKRIAKAGRAMSISLIAVTQKMSTESINSTVRSQLAVVSLTQHNNIDSNMAVGTNEAVVLENREAIVNGQGIYEKGFISILKSEQPQLELQKYVPDIIIPQKVKIKEDWDNTLTVEESNALREHEERYIVTYNKDELEELKKRKKKSELVKEQNKDREIDLRKDRKVKIKGA